jgi:hypothetical protein
MKLIIIHIGFCYYYYYYDHQLPHNNSMYSYMFRLTIVAIVRQSLSTDVCSLQYVIEWRYVR